MAAPRRFLKGISNVNADVGLGRAEFGDPMKYAIFYEDFITPATCPINAGCANDDSTWYNASVRSSAAGCTITQASSASANGMLHISIDGTDNAYGFWSLDAGCMMLRVGKKCFMESRWKIAATTQNQQELFIGLGPAGMTGYDEIFTAAGTGIASSDHLAWVLLDGTASYYHIANNNGTGTITDTTVDQTGTEWNTYSMYYDGTKIHLWKNTNLLGNYTPTGVPQTAANLASPIIYLKQGDTNARTLSVDYLFIANER